MHATEQHVINPKRISESMPADMWPWIDTKRQYLGLTQVCRQIRSEFLPLYKAQTTVSLLPVDVHDYMNTWVAPSSIDDDKIIGHVIIDVFDEEPEQLRILDIKPLLKLLRRARHLRVETFDIMDWLSNNERSIEDTLIDLYDIHNFNLFHEYMDGAMTAVEVRSSEEIGVELIFELRPEHWESWMGEWSMPDYDPNYRIPIELEENVVQWGRQCGMELDRSMGSHLTVNFRCGKHSAQDT